MKRTISIAGALAAALGSMLASVPAEAAVCSFGESTAAQACYTSPTDFFSVQLGDKFFQVLSGPTTGNGVVDWTVGPGAGGQDVWRVDIRWDDPLGLLGPAAGNFSYSVDITDPTKQFASIDMDAIVDQGTQGSVTTIEKTVFDASGAQIASLTSINGSGVSPAPIFGNRIVVNDAWSVGEGQELESVDNFIRQSDVPGPLPLMGAVSALGFCRRLRRRMAVG